MILYKRLMLKTLFTAVLGMALIFSGCASTDQDLKAALAMTPPSYEKYIIFPPKDANVKIPCYVFEAESCLKEGSNTFIIRRVSLPMASRAAAQTSATDLTRVEAASTVFSKVKKIDDQVMSVSGMDSVLPSGIAGDNSFKIKVDQYIQEHVTTFDIQWGVKYDGRDKPNESYWESFGVIMLQKDIAKRFSKEILEEKAEIDKQNKTVISQAQNRLDELRKNDWEIEKK